MDVPTSIKYYRVTIICEENMNNYKIWINGLQRMDVLDLWFTIYGLCELMVYNIWITWIYGLQRMNFVD